MSDVAVILSKIKMSQSQKSLGVCSSTPGTQFKTVEFFRRGERRKMEWDKKDLGKYVVWDGVYSQPDPTGSSEQH